MKLSNLNGNQLNHLRRAIYKIGDAISVLEELGVQVAAESISVGVDVTALDLDQMIKHLNNTPHLKALYKEL